MTGIKRVDPSEGIPTLARGGLAWSDESESYAGGSVVTGRANDPDKKWTPGRPLWGLGVELTTPSHKNVMLR